MPRQAAPLERMKNHEAIGCTAVGDGFRRRPGDDGRGKDAGLLLGGQPGELQSADQHHRHHASTPLARSTTGWSSSSAARPRSCPAWPRRWDGLGDGLTITFHLRKGVKFHRARRFKPTRDFNADDVLFSFNRQWKDDHPYHKVSGGAYDYFNDMGMPNLLKAIDKVDDHTVKSHAERAERAVPRQPRHGLRLDPLGRICRRAAEGRHAREGRPGAGRHRSLQVRRLPEGRRHPLQGQSRLLGRQAADRRPGLRHHPRCDGALREAQGGRVPGHAPTRTRPTSRR